jgi:hypothetical protein
LRQPAEQALQRFVAAAAKDMAADKGMSVNAAAREFNVPGDFLLRWAKEKGIIPILVEGKGIGSPTYIDREKAQEIAELYHEAKRQKVQPIKLLKRRKAG